MLRVFTYLRRATREGPQVNAPDPFSAWFEAHPYAVRGADFDDLGVSGLSSPPQREGFAALLAAIDADKPDFVLVLRPEDLGRSFAASVLARHLLDQRGVDLLFAQEPSRETGLDAPHP